MDGINNCDGKSRITEDSVKLLSLLSSTSSTARIFMFTRSRVDTVKKTSFFFNLLKIKTGLMEIIRRQHNVLKKASGSWAEPYSACPGLMPQGCKYT